MYEYPISKTMLRYTLFQSQNRRSIGLNARFNSHMKQYDVKHFEKDRREDVKTNVQVRDYRQQR